MPQKDTNKITSDMLVAMAGDPTTKAFSQNLSGDPTLPLVKRKRSLPGTPDPEAEVVALSPKTLMATNRFLCEICEKGFQRDQNLQLHRRAHNLPSKLRQRSSKEAARKRVYVCPEESCVHHHASRALGDLTGIKKHFCRKHGEKKWKCDKCCKRYAVQSDWKAHSKTCGTREYRCNCGTLFARRDSFVSHRAYCDALAEETARVRAAAASATGGLHYQLFGNSLRPNNMVQPFSSSVESSNDGVDCRARAELTLWTMGHGVPQTSSPPSFHQIGSTSSETLFADPFVSCSTTNSNMINPIDFQMSWVYGNKISSSNIISGELTSTSVITTSNKQETAPSLYSSSNQHHNSCHLTAAASMSATALLQKAAEMGAATASYSCQLITHEPIKQTAGMNDFQELTSNPFNDHEPTKSSTTHSSSEILDGLEGGHETRDFLGVGVQTLCPVPSTHGWI